MDAKATPFIHLMRTPYGYYFYDVNMGRIYGTSKEIYDGLEKVLAGRDAEVSPAVQMQMDEMKERGLLSDKRPKRIHNPMVEEMDYYLNHRVEGITLQLTQACNFRCTYCTYSDQKENTNRTHSSNSMSWEMAKKGIDFVMARSRDVAMPSIGFYGGEPLLKFDLLKRVVEYTESTYFGKPFHFTITTNCSLVNKEIMDYLVEHHFSLLISLDGPKAIHDQNRKFAVNGCGTYDVVMERIQFIKENYPDYFRDRVHFSVVMDPSREFSCINEMFMDGELFHDANIIASEIDDSGFQEKNTYSAEYIAQRRYSTLQTLLCQAGRIKKEALSPLIQQQLNIRESEERIFGYVKIYDTMMHGGPCAIGARKLLMNVFGDFYPCEKVNESAECMRIGNVDTGFDYEKIEQLLDIGRLTEKQCKNCWAINHCTICPRNLDVEGSISTERKREECGIVRQQVEDDLRVFLAAKELKAGGAL